MVGRRWKVGGDPAAALDLGPTGYTAVLLGNTTAPSEIVVSVVESPAVSRGLGGSYVLLFGSRAGDEWVVTHEVSLDLNDNEQLSLSHAGCFDNGTLTADLVAVISPPIVGAAVDLAAREWPATRVWRYAAGELTEHAPDDVVCSLAGE